MNVGSLSLQSDLFKVFLERPNSFDPRNKKDKKETNSQDQNYNNFINENQKEINLAVQTIKENPRAIEIAPAPKQTLTSEQFWD